jgi:hypothetical protein
MNYQTLLPLVCVSLLQACGPNPSAVSQSPPLGVQQSATAQPSSSTDNDTQVVASQAKASPDAFGLAENMTYGEARQKLIDQGWIPHTQGDPPNLRDGTVKALFNRGYEEVKDCSGTGLGPCRFEFTNKAGEILVVSTISQGKRGPDRFVWRWFIESQNPSSTAPSPSASLPFVGKRYFNFLGGSGTGHTITIDGTGKTIIELHGSQQSSVLYRGPFRERMSYESGGGITIKDGYAIQCDGSSSAPSTEGAPPCKVKLYEATPNETAAIDREQAIERIANLPEVVAWKQYIAKQSDEKVKSSLMPQGDHPVTIAGKQYWKISFNESQPTHHHRWQTFLVRVDGAEILVDDVNGGDYLDLETWRSKAKPMDRIKP